MQKIYEPFTLVLNEVDGSIRDYDGTKHLVLLGLEKYDAIFDRIISLKSGISSVASHNYGKIKIDSDDDLPLEKTDFAQCCHAYYASF